MVRYSHARERPSRRRRPGRRWRACGGSRVRGSAASVSRGPFD